MDTWSGVLCPLRGSNTPMSSYEDAPITRWVNGQVVLRRIELRSDTYKVSALTNRRQNRAFMMPRCLTLCVFV